MTAILVLGAVVLIGLIVVLWIIGVFNGLVKLRNQFKNAFSQIDVQLNRRHDLIPNLVETAKGYMKFERETLEAVTMARNQAAGAAKALAGNPANPEAMKTLMGAEGALSGALSRLMVVVEKYPDLKANENMSRLMEELTSTENRIAFARQAYNDAVMTYNVSREVFPNNVFAGAFGFAQAVLFEVTAPEIREAVKVSFA